MFMLASAVVVSTLQPPPLVTRQQLPAYAFPTLAGISIYAAVPLLLRSMLNKATLIIIELYGHKSVLINTS